MTKRKKIGVLHWCGNCYRKTMHAKCALCGKPTKEIIDKYSPIKQETLE